MIYAASITTPANTQADSPLLTRLKVTGGLVYQFELDMHFGAAGKLYAAVWDGSYQVWPSSPGEFFHGDNLHVSFPDTYLKNVAPYEFTVYTYNLSSDYSHEVQVRIGLVDEEVFVARFLPTYAYDYFVQLLDNLSMQQQARKEKQAEETIASPFPWLR